MARERLSVVVTRRLPEPVETRLSELFDVRLRDDDTPMSRAELTAAVKDADVLVPTVTDTIDAGLLGQAGERLKLIANYGAGVDHIDVATARQRGILVSNTPGVLTDDTADMAMALIMAVVRRIPEGLAIMQKGDWEAGRPRRYWAGVWPGAVWGFSAWGALVRLWRAAPGPLACRCITTTAAACALRSKSGSRPPIGKASIRWWPVWM